MFLKDDFLKSGEVFGAGRSLFVGDEFSLFLHFYSSWAASPSETARPRVKACEIRWLNGRGPETDAEKIYSSRVPTGHLKNQRYN